MSEAFGNVRFATTTEIKKTAKGIATVPVKLQIRKTSSNKYVLSNSTSLLKTNGEIVLKTSEMSSSPTATN